MPLGKVGKEVVVGGGALNGLLLKEEGGGMPKGACIWVGERVDSASFLCSECFRFSESLFSLSQSISTVVLLSLCSISLSALFFCSLPCPFLFFSVFKPFVLYQYSPGTAQVHSSIRGF